jgi:hypothetical protein
MVPINGISFQLLVVYRNRQWLSSSLMKTRMPRKVKLYSPASTCHEGQLVIYRRKIVQIGRRYWRGSIRY